MALYDKIVGTSSETFQVGLVGNVLKNHTDGLAVRDENDTVNKNLVVARPQGANADTHAAPYLDVKERVLLTEFSFDGGSPPAPGTNTGQYGICHTSGGAYNAGAIYLDDGAALTEVTVNKGHLLMSTSAVSGTVSLIANGIYIAQAATAPYSWTLKGDGTASTTGLQKAVKIPVTSTAGTFDSTTSIPSGAKILRVYSDVKTAYDGGATLEVSINGSTPLVVQATSDNRPNKVGLYANTPFSDVGATNAGLVRVTLGGAPTTGSADVVVEYYDTFLG
jgi:hypothetical protein